VKLPALLTVPTGAVVFVTVIGPVVAVEGTVAFSWVPETSTTPVPATPLKFTVELALNPTPLIVTWVPAGPVSGEKLVNENVGVNVWALVALPAAVVTLIVLGTSPAGTVAVIWLAETTVYVAGSVPKATWVAPVKKVPLIVTELPVIPETGVIELIVGGWVTTKLAALVTVPTGAVVFVTVIGPVVAVEGTVAFSWVPETSTTPVPATPLKFTVELALNPTPLIVTWVPAGPVSGEKLVNENVGVKLVALVPAPAAVVTVMLPALAPLGTVATICVAVSELTVAGVPLKLTEVALERFVPLIVTTVLPAIPLDGVNEEIVGGASTNAKFRVTHCALWNPSGAPFNWLVPHTAFGSIGSKLAPA